MLRRGLHGRELAWLTDGHRGDAGSGVGRCHLGARGALKVLKVHLFHVQVAQ